MRRPSLSNLPPSWRKTVVLAIAFAMGIAVDRLVILISPLVYRTVNVTTIHGTKGKGCRGYAHSFYALFGRPMGQADGIFEAACEEVAYLSDTEALACHCD
ncbi:MAG TPA: hypothetical protein VFU03_03230 [Gemmatimonadales bacterium]|nr:hypothetical protein [Gemmatimonadales bacterium]